MGTRLSVTVLDEEPGARIVVVISAESFEGELAGAHPSVRERIVSSQSFRARRFVNMILSPSDN